MSKAQQRVAKGLCPQCGEEAAPYYLCGRCRQIALIRRVLNRAEAAGVFKKEVNSSDRRTHRWYLSDMARSRGPGANDIPYREVMDPNDKRLRPRLRGVPVDIEREVMNILVRAGRPLSTEDILEAWGQLRVRPNRESAAADLARIVRANQKRDRRNAKRLAEMGLDQ